MVISTVRIRPSSKQRLEALELLRSVQGPVRAQPGCKACHIYEEISATSGIIFCGHWETAEDLHQHIRSELYRRILAVLELSAQPPEVCFHQVAASQGMELIEELRSNREGGSPLEPTTLNTH